MSSLDVMKALARIEQLYSQFLVGTRRIMTTLEADEQTLVAKVASGLVKIETAHKATKLPRRRRKPVVAAAAVPKKVQRRRRRKAIRRPAGEVAALIRQATAAGPQTAAELRVVLGYSSMSGVYSVLERLIAKGVLEKSQVGDEDTLYSWTFVALPSREAAEEVENGSDSAREPEHVSA